MIVDLLASREVADAVETSARLRAGLFGEFVLSVAVPPSFAPTEPDASPFLAATLQLAMRAGEPLEIDGPVSPLLLERAETVQRIYSAWNPWLRPVDVRAAETSEQPGGTGFGCFFSRGVDSMYSATCERRPPLTHLVFCDGLESLHDREVRAREIELAHEAARRIELPLVVARTNLRALTDRLVPSWDDYVAPALAFTGLSLAGGLGRALIASGDSYATLEPSGSSPLLDHLFSSEAVAIEHDSVALGRAEKTARIAAERPDLLDLLKVCFRENTPANCGWCSKCLITMVALRAAGALDAASGFPDTIDHGLIAAMRVPGRKGRLDWLEALEALRAAGADEPLERAISARLEQSAAETAARLHRRSGPSRSFREHHEATLLATLDGRPLGPRPNALTRAWRRTPRMYRLRARLGLVRPKVAPARH